MVISKYRGVKSKFDISTELSTKTIKRLYYYIVNRFFYSFSTPKSFCNKKLNLHDGDS